MESSEWYDEQTSGLGERFAEIIHSDINTIVKDPLIYKKVKSNVREFIVDQFPYLIIYECKNEMAPGADEHLTNHSLNQLIHPFIQPTQLFQQTLSYFKSITYLCHPIERRYLRNYDHY